MDYGSVEAIMDKRERGYILMERKLKWNLAVTTLFVTASFLFVPVWVIKHENESFWPGLFLFFLLVVLANAIWQFFSYREEYREYEVIREYLEAFENGDYEFRREEAGVRLGIHSQITEQLERLGRAFCVIREQLEAEKEGTRELVTDISHQIKTPVSAIGVSLELMEDDKVTWEEKSEFLDRAQQEVKKLNDLLETLLRLSQLERGMIRLRQEETSLKETLIRAVNGVYLKANEKKIEIELEEFSDIRLRHDVKWTAEAFANVIENAVKYSPEYSCVKIRVEPYVSYVAVEVEDEGIGVEKKEYADIFKRFYRGKEAEKRVREGAGVGLYLVRKILEEQGGSVRVLSSGRRGSVFQMVLPK